jgi:hypothetical protein
MRRAWVAAIALGAVSATPAEAYEFWLRTQSIGQVYQLRQYRLVGPDLFQGRRRYTQTLALRIDDIGDLSRSRRESRLPDRGLRISWQSYLRVDHDFGTFTNGRIRLSPVVRRDAIDVIPELAESVAGLDLLYGHFTFDGLADDRLTVKLGRLLQDDGWQSLGVDGGSVRFELPGVPLAISADAGLRVRADSPMGLAELELDGTTGAGCTEYVEGAMPGTGTWQLVDRARRITNSRLTSDYELCPQRLMRQPTIGVEVATADTRNVGAAIGYRRTWSETFGLIGEADRLEQTDLGLYPNEFGQGPASGVNEERIHARVHGRLRAGALAIEPYANARVSLLHAALDRVDAGVRLVRGEHTLEPAVAYFLPTFDGDSIFNVFSIEPTKDVRLSYWRQGTTRWRADAWLRRYAHETGLSSYSGGLQAGLDQPLGKRWRGALDALWDDGYGGRRVGGTGEVAWRAHDDIWLRGRVIVLGVAPDASADRPAYVTSSTVISSSFALAESVALHVIAEADRDAIHDLQLRGLAVLDFAFMPEIHK